MDKINWKSVGIKIGIITFIGMGIFIFIMSRIIRDLSSVTLDLSKQNSEIVEWVDKIEKRIAQWGQESGAEGFQSWPFYPLV